MMGTRGCHELTINRLHLLFLCLLHQSPLINALSNRLTDLHPLTFPITSITNHENRGLQFKIVRYLGKRIDSFSHALVLSHLNHEAGMIGTDMVSNLSFSSASC